MHSILLYPDLCYTLVGACFATIIQYCLENFVEAGWAYTTRTRGSNHGHVASEPNDWATASQRHTNSFLEKVYFIKYWELKLGRKNNTVLVTFIWPFLLKSTSLIWNNKASWDNGKHCWSLFVQSTWIEEIWKENGALLNSSPLFYFLPSLANSSAEFKIRILVIFSFTLSAFLIFFNIRYGWLKILRFLLKCSKNFFRYSENHLLDLIVKNIIKTIRAIPFTIG